MPFYTYILRCENDRLYVGSCQKLQERFQAHLEERGAAFTRRHKPLSIAFSKCYPSRAEAMARETQIKKWSRAKKQALIEQNSSELKRLSRSHDQ
ncbi:GIY-YIG nuclease family protein [Coraliomargarita akajimensis]|uniref:GIY-YIG nuclease family protein n=1 Tax=Coraliomargarita akajimensis TaxID=395922 RepID=UPI000A02CAD3